MCCKSKEGAYISWITLIIASYFIKQTGIFLMRSFACQLRHQLTTQQNICLISCPVIVQSQYVLVQPDCMDYSVSSAIRRWLEVSLG